MPTKNVKYVSVQERYEDKQFFQHCKPPPPPPGDSDLWELQFCRWWGWNWVRKKEDRYVKEDDVICCREKRHANKPIRDLCNCLCFKKEPRVTPSLQNMYNTPSNTFKPERVTNCKMDSMEQLQHRRNISQKSRRGCCMVCSNNLSSSSDDYYRSKPEKYRSCSDDSVEYINISCCRCCHCKKKASPEICNCETQTSKHCNVTTNITQTSRHDKNNGATQTSKRCKKKRIRLICCHCSETDCCKCRRDSPPEKLMISTQTQSDECIKCNVKCDEKKCPLKTKKETVYMSGVQYPWDRMLYYNKHFSKFGHPSQNYPWLFEAQSDISDKLYSLKIEKEFSSPVSGHIYDLTPKKVDTFDTKPTLSDPMEVGKKFNYLKSLEKEVKMDLDNRVMLDAVCDAILSDCKTSTSAILNEFSYSNNTEPDNAIYETSNSEFDLGNFRNCAVDEGNYFSVIKDFGNEYLNTDLDKIPLNTGLHMNQDRNLLDSDGLQALLKTSLSNCDLTLQRAGLQQIAENSTRKMRINSRDRNISNEAATILNPSMKKRCATCKYCDNLSPSPERANRSRWDDSYTPANIGEIFNKIDEIVLKSKVNNEEIKNVLNAIPKRTYQICCSTEDIMNPNEANLFLKISSTKSTLKDEPDLTSNLEKQDETSLANDVEEKCVKKVVITKKRKKGPKPSFTLGKTDDKQKGKKKN